MYEKEIIVNHDAGVHARPASMIARISQKYKNCDIRIIRDEEQADAKSVLTVLALGVANGKKLIIRADGEGEQEVVDRLYNLFETNFDKDQNPL